MEKQENNRIMFESDYKSGNLSQSALNALLIANGLKTNNDSTDKNKSDSISQLQKISIVIPTCNRVKQLTQCIESIQKQSYQNFEIVLIDDCSTDDTNKQYSNHKDKRIKYYLNKKNLGMGLNRHKAYNILTGDLVIFMDDDDYFIDDDYFADAVKIFNNIDIDIICSNSYIHYESENRYVNYSINMYGKKKCIDYLSKFQFKYLKPTSSFPAIFRKELLEKANFANMKMMNDSCLYLRALAFGNCVYFNNKYIGIYRVHNSNYTSHVKANFTIENLEEKLEIFNIIKSKLKNPKKWFFNEIKITVCYFLNGSEKDKNEINKVLNWTRINISALAYYYFNIYNLIQRNKNR